MSNALCIDIPLPFDDSSLSGVCSIHLTRVYSYGFTHVASCSDPRPIAELIKRDRNSSLVQKLIIAITRHTSQTSWYNIHNRRDYRYDKGELCVRDEYYECTPELASTGNASLKVCTASET